MNVSVTASVVVVEDDDDLRSSEVFLLEQVGYQVVGLPSAESLYRYLVTATPEAVLLDIGLPGEDGLSAARHLRLHSPDLIIIFVTAFGSTENRIAGMEAGGDAYLTKPIDMRECVLLIERLLVRQRAAANSISLPILPPEVFDETEFGWRLLRSSNTLVSPVQQSINLTQREVDLLVILMTEVDLLVSKEKILAAGYDDEQDWHRVENQLLRLRRKVKETTGQVLPVRSVFGKGLVFAAKGCIV